MFFLFYQRVMMIYRATFAVLGPVPPYILHIATLYPPYKLIRRNQRWYGVGTMVERQPKKGGCQPFETAPFFLQLESNAVNHDPFSAHRAYDLRFFPDVPAVLF